MVKQKARFPFQVEGASDEQKQATALQFYIHDGTLGLLRQKNIGQPDMNELSIALRQFLYTAPGPRPKLFTTIDVNAVSNIILDKDSVVLSMLYSPKGGESKPWSQRARQMATLNLKDRVQRTSRRVLLIRLRCR